MSKIFEKEQYIAPGFDYMVFETESVITDSSIGDNDGKFPWLTSQSYGLE